MMSEGGLVWQQIGAVKELVLRAAFQKKPPYGGTLSQLGGKGVKKTLKCPYLKCHLTRELF